MDIRFPWTLSPVASPSTSTKVWEMLCRRAASNTFRAWQYEPSAKMHNNAVKTANPSASHPKPRTNLRIAPTVTGTTRVSAPNPSAIRARPVHNAAIQNRTRSCMSAWYEEGYLISLVVDELPQRTCPGLSNPSEQRWRPKGEIPGTSLRPRRRSPRDARPHSGSPRRSRRPQRVDGGSRHLHRAETKTDQIREHRVTRPSAGHAPPACPPRQRCLLDR